MKTIVVCTSQGCKYNNELGECNRYEIEINNGECESYEELNEED